MSIKSLVIVGAIACVCLGLFFGLIGYNAAPNYQIIQEVNGDLSVRDEAGYYYKGFATVTDYPRVMRAHYSAKEGEGNLKDDESIVITFNDGGIANVNTYMQMALPVTAEERLELHRTFSGNPTNVLYAVKAHLTNCLKNSAPIMSSSEHQSARQGEFNQVTEAQMKKGLFVTKRIEKDTEIKDANGKLTTILATEIVLDDAKNPVIAQVSPLIQYGVIIEQFSVTSTDYDKVTLEQFAMKKQAYLGAEQAKADRQKYEQEKLKVDAQGLSEKAKVEAESNKEKAAAVIAATMAAEVAEQRKTEETTKAAMKVSIAEQDKLAAEMLAAQNYAVAKLNKQAAEENAAAIVILAAAEEKRIKMAGAVTQKEQILAEIQAQRDVDVAKYLSQIKVPGIVITGVGSGGEKGLGGDGNQLTQTMMNMLMLRELGVMDKPEEVQAVN